MPQVINTNVQSLNAQRNLNSSSSQLSVSLQRLSSGLRINSAKDDAAGLAISNRMTAQIRGLNQAARNANDGISLAQTAEGDLGAITTSLQRIRELAVQSANATNSSTDRAALQSEAAQLIAEIDRISVASSFNGVSLLDGTFTSQQFQVGANAGQTIDVASIASARTADLGQRDTATLANTTNVTGALSAGDLTINGTDIGAVSGDAAAIAAAITASSVDVTATATNAQTAVTFGDVVGTVAVAEVFTATASFTLADFSGTSLVFDITDENGTDTITLNSDYSGGSTITDVVNDIQAQISNTSITVGENSGTLTYTSSTAATANAISVSHTSGGTANQVEGTVTTAGADAVAPTYTLSIDGTALDFTAVAADGTITSADLKTVIDAQATGYTVTDNTGNIDITKADGSNIVFVEAGSDSDGAEGLAGGTGGAGVTSTLRGVVNSIVSSGEALVIAGAAPGNAGLTAATTALSGTLGGTTIANTDVSTVSGANAAIISIDAALDTINSSRGDLGAIQSRFESVVGALSTTAENLSAARSRIQDTDFAAETALLTRNQILQQAGISILSQANAQPQLVLSLLQ